MKILLISIVLALNIWLSQGQNKFATCQRAWTKIGCFKDNIKPSRPLPEMLLNDRDRYSKYHEKGYLLNWHKWEESIHSLACRCAERAQQKGYNVFGLQFYGECWSGPFAEFNYTRDGQASPNKCIMNLNKPNDCVQDEDQECVGLHKANYIYKLTANPGPQSPDVDGGYTPWSQWTQCSKTCGGGEKARERTCTNPEPKGNGKSCDRLGEPEDIAKCNDQKCDVDGGYTPWSQWSNCSSCGIGKLSRARNCTNPKPQGNGKSCDHLGQPAKESKACYIRECDDCDRKKDICIIIDSSSSVRRDNYEKVKTFLVNFVKGVHVSEFETRVAVIHYNHRSFVDWDFQSPLAKDSGKLEVGILNLKYQPGGTRTDTALEKCNAAFEKSHGQRPDAVDILLVITDGKTNSRSKPYKVVLKPLQDKGVKIVAVGVGKRVDVAELEEITAGNKDNVIKLNKFDELVNIIKEIVKKVCKARNLGSQMY